jgi:ERF superfamily
MNQIATRDEQQTALAAAGEPDNMLAMIWRASRDPLVDAGKLNALLDVQERVENRQAIRAFIEAETGMQSEIPSIGKKGQITNKAGGVQSKYSRWEDIHRVINPILQRHHFTLSFEIDTVEQMIAVQATLSHVAGHIKKSGFMRLPRDDSGAKNGVQGVGSAMSYGKRYTTIALLNINTEGEDNDGGTAAARGKEFSELGAKGEAFAAKGMMAYREWFKEVLTSEQQRVLADSGEHDRLKKLATEADIFTGDRAL